MQQFVKWKKYGTLGSSVKNRNDLSDYDYLHKLDKESLAWLKGFHREYVNADFKHKYKKLIKGKKKRKAVYDANNSRNRDFQDVYSITEFMKLAYEAGKAGEELVFSSTETEEYL